MAGRALERELVLAFEGRKNIFRLEFPVSCIGLLCARPRDSGRTRRGRAGLPSSVSEA